MKQLRRVVTGHNAAGRAVFACDEAVPVVPIPGMPGFETCELWGADATLSYPDDGGQPPHADFFPPVGGFRFRMFTIPPDRAAAGQAASAQAMQEGAPSLAATMTGGKPGMHRSDSVDLLFVISGRCVLELDDGATIELRAGDTAVQSGTMHAWSNPFDEPCRIVGAVFGARRG
ncbi:MAG: cupin domain-containing protein [Nevskia sp.]|nr:cupin domain-containing protein [Nevskia sp.]